MVFTIAFIIKVHFRMSDDVE